jgi:hypothetical protein
MTGTFTRKVYPWDSTKGLDVSGPPVQTVTGTVTAQRVTINSGYGARNRTNLAIGEAVSRHPPPQPRGRTFFWRIDVVGDCWLHA